MYRNRRVSENKMALQWNEGIPFVGWIQMKSWCMAHAVGLAVPEGDYKERFRKLLIPCLCGILSLSLFFWSQCVYPCSAVQKHGSRRVDKGFQALFSSGSWESAEGGLAQETAEYHEKLAAALVCPEDRSSVFLQGSGWKQSTGIAK